MTNLTSKLQYKTCEKGEFFDEKPRSLTETIDLVKSFPWDKERGADVQASGPGIVIEGTSGDYLKVALYFNGKFSLYYLDAGAHLYEYHTPELLDECKKVKDFFEDRLNLDDFEKHFFNIGYRNHFESKSFVYRVSFIRSILILLSLELFILLIVNINSHINIPLKITLSLFSTTIIALIIFGIYYSFNNYYIRISKGHDDFDYSDIKGHLASYNKQNVTEVVIDHRQKSYAYNSSPFYYATIHFKDGSYIKVPDILIPGYQLQAKFSEKLVKFEYRHFWKSI